MNQANDLNALPAHIVAILAGNISASNQVEIKPLKTSKQLTIEKLQSDNAPVMVITNAQSAIEDIDYSFDYHEAIAGEVLTIEA